MSLKIIPSTNNFRSRLSSLYVFSSGATSTFANGIQLSGGCFKDITGSCVGGGGVSTYLALTDTQSSFTANRIIHTNSGTTALTDTAGFVFDGTSFGIGSTTPAQTLSVQGGALIAGTTTAQHLYATSTLAVGDSFGSRFIVTQDGRVGVGTTSPAVIFSVSGDTLLGGSATTTGLFYSQHTGTSTFKGEIGRASCRKECRSRWSPYH